MRKTKGVHVVQSNYGQGWEDVTQEDTRKEARARLQEYDENEHYPHRLITRRERIFEYGHDTWAEAVKK